jgi:hypothetical protein
LTTQARPKTLPTKEGKGHPVRDKPWDAYRRESSGEGQGRLHHKLLQPGWGGTLDDTELQFVLSKLQADPVLSYWWGFRPQTKRRPIDAIKAVALHGNSEVRGDNVKLVRKHGTPVATQMALPWG